MVGNSFESDILPVLELGGHAIYIPSEIIWAHEVTQEIEHPRLCKANNIESVPTLLNLK
jgi:putative hydrolase of the HAD superfamily